MCGAHEMLTPAQHGAARSRVSETLEGQSHQRQASNLEMSFLGVVRMVPGSHKQQGHCIQCERGCSGACRVVPHLPRSQQPLHCSRCSSSWLKVRHFLLFAAEWLESHQCDFGTQLPLVKSYTYSIVSPKISLLLDKQRDANMLHEGAKAKMREAAEPRRSSSIEPSQARYHAKIIYSKRKGDIEPVL
jgi:hypothetical protein